MRQKELRIALVCYGGISLAVYMHGVTKELWKLVCASRDIAAGGPDHGAAEPGGVERVYADMLRGIAERGAERGGGLRIRVMCDIIAGASAGGINGVFLAQAIHSGQSLEPLTDLWLERADVDQLLDPDAHLFTRFLKFWAVPAVNFLLTRPGNVVSASVARETRAEVRAKLSRLVRSRWFEAPFGGIGFSRLLAEALDAMAQGPVSMPLLPRGHPLDLFVTATDFRGHPERLRLNSPREVNEDEHRLSIGFRRLTPAKPGKPLADPIELVLAARATASFPGAFPALQIAEIDALAAERVGRGLNGWTRRGSFLARVLPHLTTPEALAGAALIDGSVLVNAPFAEAMAALPGRPAQREVDRRLVYIDPRPHGPPGPARDKKRGPGFFPVIFGSLSTIPREQPIRDNLEQLARESREMAQLRGVITAIRPDVEVAVEQLFGRTLFLDSPSPRRLALWRDKAQRAARARAGYAYAAYAQLKYSGVMEALITLVAQAAPGADADALRAALADHAVSHGIDPVINTSGEIAPAALMFLRAHDLGFRIRRLRLLARRLTQDWEALPGVSNADREAAREAVYQALALCFNVPGASEMGAGFAALAVNCQREPGAVLDAIASARALIALDGAVERVLGAAMAASPKPLRRVLLLAYLGFPFYDVATLPMLRGADFTEFDPVKVDRISPQDAIAIRSGGADACLRGVEFYNFGAFFSRAYRENDYLWGRLHGAERLIDLVASSAHGNGDAGGGHDAFAAIKTAAFLAILEEEEHRITADPSLIATIRAEILARAAVP